MCCRLTIYYKFKRLFFVHFLRYKWLACFILPPFMWVSFFGWSRKRGKSNCLNLTLYLPVSFIILKPDNQSCYCLNVLKFYLDITSLKGTSCEWNDNYKAVRNGILILYNSKTLIIEDICINKLLFEIHTKGFYQYHEIWCVYMCCFWK